MYDFSHPDWNSLHDHLRHVPWEDIFKPSASVLVNFVSRFSLKIDVYVSYCKYQVKPHSSP